MAGFFLLAASGVLAFVPLDAKAQSRCPPGYKDAAGACVQTCPSGYEDQGRTCVFRSYGGRGG
jgi:hypothetical protein